MKNNGSIKNISISLNHHAWRRHNVAALWRLYGGKNSGAGSSVLAASSAAAFITPWRHVYQRRRQTGGMWRSSGDGVAA